MARQPFFDESGFARFIIPQRRPAGFYASLCWRRRSHLSHFPKRRYTTAPPDRILCEPLLAAQSKMLSHFPKRQYTIAPPDRVLCEPLLAAQSKMLSHFPKRRYTTTPPSRVLCEPLLAAQSSIFRISPKQYYTICLQIGEYINAPPCGRSRSGARMLYNPSFLLQLADKGGPNSHSLASILVRSRWCGNRRPPLQNRPWSIPRSSA